MKKLLGVLAVCFSFWFAGLTIVHAEIKPLPPDYDPIQGGMILKPPRELWVQAKTTLTAMIPFAYLPGGPLDVTQLQQVHYEVELDGTKTPVPIVANQGAVSVDSKVDLNFGAVSGGLGILVRANRVEDYSLTLFFSFGQSSDEYETNLTLHVVSTLSPITWAETTSTKSMMSPLPQLVLWHHVGPEVTVERSTATTLDSNELKWPISPLFYLVGSTAVRVNGAIGLLPFVRQLALTTNGLTATQTFGMPNVTGYQGKPLVVDIDYIHPRPGTRLQFLWQFVSTLSPALSTQQFETTSLTIPADRIMQANGTLELTLRYSDGNSSVEYRSTTRNYTYQRATQTQQPFSLGSGLFFLSIADLIQGPVTVNANLPDWQVDQVGPWRFTLSVTALRQDNGTILPASLKWPTGGSITSNQPYTTVYNGPQVVPLSQIEWVFQQQPAAVAGQYQAQIQFQAIAGP